MTSCGERSRQGHSQRLALRYLAPMAVLPVSEASFETEVLTSGIPVLIDLYAEWCQPCKQLAPILDDVSRELDGRLKVVRIDVDQSPRIAQAFQVRSVPMLALFANGRVEKTLTGVVPKAQILDMVRPHLPREPGAPEEIAAKDLSALLARRRAVPVDIRERAVYERNRIPSAIHVAEDQLLEHGSALTGLGATPVLYCRGGDRSKEAAKALAARGVHVAILTGGLLGWEAEGLSVDRGPIGKA